MERLISKNAAEILIIGLISGIILSGVSLPFGLRSATSVSLGVLLSYSNLLFYTLIFWLILSKKNIASLVPVIVIKYSILLLIIYYVWAYFDALLVVLGLSGEIVLTALIWLAVRLIKDRN